MYDGEQLCARRAALLTDRSTWDSMWQDLGNMVMPRKSEITEKRDTPDVSKEQRLFDSTVIDANQTLANGQMSWMTPHETRWFAFDAPDELKGNDEAEAWFSDCTDRMHPLISRSNFYSEVHELYLDRGGYGTACLHVEEGKKTPFFFKAWGVGSFSIAEDDEGMVDTIYRDFKLTVRQAEMRFGRDKLPSKLLAALEDPKKMDEKHEFCHAIFPRDPGTIDPRKMDPENMPIASVTFYVADKHICNVGGYLEMPSFVTRYFAWGESPYGWAPSWAALPDARQLQFLEKQMDALAEVTAFPRMLIPGDFEGELDVRASGVTYFDGSKPQSMPKEWMTGGRYDVGQARAEEKRERIRRFFHTDLFRMFATLDKQMTAREVAERSSEKLVQFAPTFFRLTGELFNPMLTRLFNLTLRSGGFAPPPDSIFQQDAGGVYLPTPKVSYNSRVALAVKALENNSFSRTLEMIGPLVQIRPDMLDNYNLDRIARDSARNDGLPADWMNDEETVAAIREQRAAAAEKQAQAEQAALMADSAAKVGGIPPGSPVIQAFKGAAA